MTLIGIQKDIDVLKSFNFLRKEWKPEASAAQPSLEIGFTGQSQFTTKLLGHRKTITVGGASKKSPLPSSQKAMIKLAVPEGRRTRNQVEEEVPVMSTSEGSHSYNQRFPFQRRARSISPGQKDQQSPHSPQEQREGSPAAMHRGNRQPVVADRATNFVIGGDRDHDPELKRQFQRAVDHFLRGEYDKISEDEAGLNTSGGLIATGITDDKDDGYGYDDMGLRFEAPAATEAEDRFDQWLSKNKGDERIDFKLKMAEQREMIEQSCRNDKNLQPAAIMSKIKESQAHDEGDQKRYIIDDPELEADCIGEADDWMFTTHLKLAPEDPPQSCHSSPEKPETVIECEPEISQPEKCDPDTVR
jgi:hypothetical protein